ncbi:hypothetical protein CORC01_12257 [Colletotrichum orchidophilum]|uniref:IDI-2 n=1 Tax=Colletotrichum orchidophilum TaxID=1209926 RepID=A0A1G4ATP4_9PEZI|nr:uncharacterized protein CORC01_12257 [Colletotrichum orchidophilum]OHE92466.1 hypothetical protein CORC01_12257 [Colletotrichum orchidophilum]
MKPVQLFLFATPILAGVAPATAAEKCGNLGVMAYTAASLDAAGGVDPAQIRACQEHPLGPDPRPEHAVGPRPQASPTPTPSPASSSIEDVDGKEGNSTVSHWGWGWHHGGWGNCWDVDPGDYGCSGGYCYKACDGDGRWCWTARNKGYGSWKKCDTKSDCANMDDLACGRGCKSCGCSC